MLLGFGVGADRPPTQLKALLHSNVGLHCDDKSVKMKVMAETN